MLSSDVNFIEPCVTSVTLTSPAASSGKWMISGYNYYLNIVLDIRDDANDALFLVKPFLENGGIPRLQRHPSFLRYSTSILAPYGGDNDDNAIASPRRRGVV